MLDVVLAWGAALTLIGCDLDNGRSNVAPGNIIAPPGLSPIIGDTLWVDDGDGIQENGELGLSGVRVSVHALGGALIEEVISGPDGSYEVVVPSNLVQAGPATFLVTVEVPLGATPAPCDQGSDDAIDSDCSPVSVVLGLNERIDTIDFGFVLPSLTGTIGNRVWVDVDGDGLQGEGEPGIDFVDVVLRDSALNVIATVTTDNDGRYRFVGLDAGWYRVEVDVTTLPRVLGVPAVQTTPNVATGSLFAAAFDSDDSPAEVVLRSSDERNLTIDFGFLVPFDGAVGDLVWHDLNNDGLQDPDELGLVGIEVVLRDDSGLEVARAVTGPSGRYHFFGMPPSIYTVEVVQSTLPDGFEETLCHVGSDGARDSECGQAIFEVLVGGARNRDMDFGFRSAFTGTIRGRVWLDQDGDGMQGADEVGLEEIGLQIVDALGAVVYRTAAEGNGRHRFTGLSPGVYRVQVDTDTVPPQLTPIPCAPGQPGCHTRTVEVPSSMSVDFGYRSEQTERIGDRAFLDHDGDGLQDPHSTPFEHLPGVRVVLRDSLARLVDVRTSDSHGRYEFHGLRSGAIYRVAFDPNSISHELSPALADVGLDDSIDSDRSPVFKSLLPGEPTDDVDFGFVDSRRCVVLDFTTDDRGIVLTNGQDISSTQEFGALVRIDGLGPWNAGAAIFDSTAGGPNAGGPDPDLLVGLGNILILQELGSTQTIPGYFDQANEAAGGGTLQFEFTADSELRSIDLIGMGLIGAPISATLTLVDRQRRARTYSVPHGWTGSIDEFGPPGYRTLDLTTLDPQIGFGHRGGPPASFATATEDSGFDARRVIRMTIVLNDSSALDNLAFCR